MHVWEKRRNQQREIEKEPTVRSEEDLEGGVSSKSSEESLSRSKVKSPV